jgi:hypothetical protein
LKNKKKEKRKTMWKNIVEIHSILKEKNYKAKFLTSSILKKVKSTKIILKKKINKKGESWEKRKVILGKKKEKRGKLGKKESNFGKKKEKRGNLEKKDEKKTKK